MRARQPFGLVNGEILRRWVGSCLDHFVLQFTKIFGGVGGVICANIAGLCRVLAMTFICCVCLWGPIFVFLWCIQSIWMVWFFCWRFYS